MKELEPSVVEYRAMMVTLNQDDPDRLVYATDLETDETRCGVNATNEWSLPLRTLPGPRSNTEACLRWRFQKGRR